MKEITRRIKKLSQLEYIFKKLRKYAFAETITLITVFLIIGYLVDPIDICLTHQRIPFLLILLSILTLFHGFESGFIAIGIISLSMWKFYEKFPYTDFLVYLMMVLIFSEFHYYWTKKIRELSISDDYKASKLDELSKAFYTLKISHDQLEKNYVLKPMSIRSAIENIIFKTKQQKQEGNISNSSAQYQDFLILLEKSFNLQSGLLIYRTLEDDTKTLTKANSAMLFNSSFEHNDDESKIYDDYMVTYALNRKKPVFVSDEMKNPALDSLDDSRFLAAIPTVYDNEVLTLLLIEKMPFMAFNKENLISISILLEYLSIEIHKKEVLQQSTKIETLFDENSFKYEYTRLQHLQKKYKINSTLLVIKMDNELQNIRVFEKTQRLLRSLDIVTQTHLKEFYYLVVLFPLNDHSVALGFLNRLLYNLKNEKDKAFEYMTFDIMQENLLYQYITDDYHG